MMQPLKVLVTGAAGQIAYSIIPMICNGDAFGADQCIDLVLLDLPFLENKLKGVHMEVEDCAFPLVKSCKITTVQAEAFKDIDFALLIGSMPRKDGMQRSDLLSKNKEIFEQQGKLLNTMSKPTVKVVVVGNPANTNCLIAMKNADRIPKKNFTSLSRLDHNRLKTQVSLKSGVPVVDIKKVAIWGNHSLTQYPDMNHCVIKTQSGEVGKATTVINDEKWMNEVMIPTVQSRGAAVIEMRQLSSAMSAAKAVVDHVRSWVLGTPEGEWVSMGVLSDGSYGTTEGLIFSFPVTCSNGEYHIVKGLEIDEFSKQKISETNQELLSEKKLALNE